MNKPVKNRVITSREEAEAEQRARQLQQQGMAAFGDPNQRFDLDAEPEFPTGEQDEYETESAPAPVETPVPVAPKKAPVAKQRPAPVVPTAGPEEKQDDLPEELSDDPATKMEQVSKIFSKNNPGFPSGQTLLNWKNMAGNIFILDAGENVFIYRYLKRQEWIQMNQDPAFLKQRVDQREDTLFNKCVLWPRLGPEKIAALPAGAVSSIVAQIEQQSMFIDPRELANVTIKL